MVGKHKKKGFVNPRDGMTDETRRHFDHVKQNMFAFIGQLHPGNLVRDHRAATPALRDQKFLKPPQHHRGRRGSHDAQRKQPPTPWLQPRPMPVAFATPQLPHRLRQ